MSPIMAEITAAALTARRLFNWSRRQVEVREQMLADLRARVEMFAPKRRKND